MRTTTWIRAGGGVEAPTYMHLVTFHWSDRLCPPSRPCFLYTIRVIRVPHSLRPAASYGNSKLHVIAPGSCITDTAGSSIIARSVQHQGTSAATPGGTNSARPGEATAAGSFSRHQNNGSEISAAPANNQGCVAIGGSNGGAGGIGERIVDFPSPCDYTLACPSL